MAAARVVVCEYFCKIRQLARFLLEVGESFAAAHEQRKAVADALLGVNEVGENRDMSSVAARRTAHV